MSDLLKLTGRLKSNWRSFTLQLIFITILPLTILVFIVAFGSQSLHMDAMRSLVGDRDLRTVRAASGSLEREISHLSSMLQTLSRSLSEQPDFSKLVIPQEEILSLFDGGIALISPDGRVIQSVTNGVNWPAIPALFPNLVQPGAGNPDRVTFSSPTPAGFSTRAYILISVPVDSSRTLVGAFTPARLIQDAIGDLSSLGETTVLVIAPSSAHGAYDVLYRGGPVKADEMDPHHPGMMEALNGESGINYFQSSEGEHVVAFTPVRPIGWGLIVEEAWHDIANPTLVNTQAAPLVIVPIFLLALAAIWFGVRQIVAPLQKLEKQAANLAQGNFEAIHQPVGGIEEIRNLQSELIEMADRLEDAQQSLHSYIGSITAGVENERRSLARDLHDDTIQSLIALNQRIQLLLMETPEKKRSQLKELQALVEQSILHLRRTIRGLRPIYLEEFGLAASLDMLIKELRETTAIVLSFEISGEECRFEPQRELSLYRMVQESLSNVIRHSGASHAWVTLEFSEKECAIRIRDDGRGFRVPSNPAESSRQGHFGLLGQYERAELIGAALSIQSSPGSGTTVLIRLPLDRPMEPSETSVPGSENREEGSNGSE